MEMSGGGANRGKHRAESAFLKEFMRRRSDIRNAVTEIRVKVSGQVLYKTSSTHNIHVLHVCTRILKIYVTSHESVLTGTERDMGKGE